MAAGMTSISPTTAGDADTDRQGFPDRAAFGDVVDGVRRAHERGDVARGGPERGDDTDDRGETGRARVFDLSEDCVDQVLQLLVGTQLADRVLDRLLSVAAEHAEQ